MKKIFFSVLLFSLSILLVGCTQVPSKTVDHSDFTGALQTVLSALKHQDFSTLATFVWPQGLRFSPYEYVNIETDVILDTKIIINATTINRSYVWWISDGKWDPIDLWIGQYFEKFVNDADYANAPEVLYNQSKQRGNTTNNIAEVYSWKSWVEFYFSWFDPKYQWIDRKSLTLIFDHVNGQRYLVGIVHGAWTI